MNTRVIMYYLCSIDNSIQRKVIGQSQRENTGSKTNTKQNTMFKIQKKTDPDRHWQVAAVHLFKLDSSADLEK